MAVQHITFPFTYEEEDLFEENAVSYTKAVFTDDFGLFKKDEQIEFLSVDFAESQVEEWTESGERQRIQKFKAVPIQ
jgi:hypothetical protein